MVRFPPTCGWKGVNYQFSFCSEGILSIVVEVLWTVLACGSHHLISQAGWNRCYFNLILLSIN